MKATKKAPASATAKSNYATNLSSVGNPDHGQYAPVSNPETVTADTFAELKAKIRAYIEFWNLGGGNWTRPVIMQQGKAVGRMSYNGRVWADDGAEVAL